eukprot:TRINITY_DN21_c0_g1_i2.p1 TRINITY_DN21_c0_g1~~TRINITY_DN21_c0_g1_i2.p1  ORF type:complete len:145 (+),score=28.97 TRINITY_DN21_c0_g1_i2:372-806(+)
MTGKLTVDLNVRGGYRPTTSSTHTKSSTSASFAPATIQRPVATPKLTPQQLASGIVLTFSLPGVGGDTNVKFIPRDVSGAYLFEPTPASTDTLVEAQQIDSKTLIIKSIPRVGNPVAQKFNLPFEWSQKDISLQGSSIRLNFSF